MVDKEDQIEGMLFFASKSTYGASYRHGQVLEPITTEFKPRLLKKRHYQYKPGSVWNPPLVRFDLMHKPKEIIRTHPRIVPEPCGKDVTSEQIQETLQCRKTRPRLVMTPAVGMDDIADEYKREIICKDLYTTEVMKSQREAIKPLPKVEAPLSPLPAPANPLALKKLAPPYVPAEWRMETITWDRKQLRCYCDPTEEFWKRYPPLKCRACHESAIVAAHRKIMTNKNR